MEFQRSSYLTVIASDRRKRGNLVRWTPVFTGVRSPRRPPGRTSRDDGLSTYVIPAKVGNHLLAIPRRGKFYIDVTVTKQNYDWR